MRNPHIEGIGLSADRVADAASISAPTRDCLVVSADSHFEVSEDIYRDRLPAHLRDKAPRVWFDGFWRLGDPKDQSKQLFSDFAFQYRVKHSCAGLYERNVRKRDAQASGVDKEIVFPQSVLHFLTNPDYELREAVFRVYNEYISEVSAQDRDRFYGVGICANWWDAERAKATITEVKNLGLRTFMLPNTPGRYPSGKEISWGDEELEPFWSAIEEAELPICFHVIEKFDVDGPGGVGTFMLTALSPFRRPFAMLTFGGVFDRHPKIKVVFAEGGISWVPTMLQDAEMIFDSFTGFLRPKLKRRPSDYWRAHCFATFQTDRLGLEQLSYIGVDNVMWGSDYPHTEGTYGYTRSAQQAIIDCVGQRDANKILGATAMSLYRL